MEIEEIRNEHDAELDKVKDDKRALVQEIQALKFAIEKGIDDHAGWPSPVKRAHNEMQKKLHVVEEDFANFRRSRQQDDEYVFINIFKFGSLHRNRIYVSRSFFHFRS